MDVKEQEESEMSFSNNEAAISRLGADLSVGVVVADPHGLATILTIAKYVDSKSSIIDQRTIAEGKRVTIRFHSDRKATLFVNLLH